MSPSPGIVDSDAMELSIGGLRVAARATGSGDPVLLLNGMSRPMESWAYFADALQDRTVIAFDAPGVGASETPVVPYSMPMLADTAARVLDAFGIEKAVSSDTPTAARSPSSWRSVMPPA
jgi:pimeloyl-ACP methyl ester carboxylesterase